MADKLNCCNCNPTAPSIGRNNEANLKCSCGPPPVKCPEKKNPDEMPIIPLKEIKRFAYDCLVAAGAAPENAVVHAEMLADSDYRGYFSEGLLQLEFYCKALKRKQINGKESPEIISETVGCALVDGHNALGSVVGKFCMDLAMKKAIQIGVGVVAVRGSTPFGKCSYYIQRAIKEGVIGIVFSNTEPRVVPPGAKESALGMNPIGFGAPIGCGDSILMDMSTSIATRLRIELAKRKGHNIPYGWALDTQCQVVTDPEEALKANKLLPLEGTTETGLNKGFGLGLCIEILTGILAGGNFGPKIPLMENETSEPPNICHFFMALNPDTFGPGFRDRLKWLAHSIRNLEPIDPNNPVLVPGDNEKSRIEKMEEQGGIRYDKKQMGMCMRLSYELKVRPLLEEKPNL